MVWWKEGGKGLSSSSMSMDLFWWAVGYFVSEESWCLELSLILVFFPSLKDCSPPSGRQICRAMLKLNDSAVLHRGCVALSYLHF